MAIRGIALTVTYTAWDTINNSIKINDVANHTIKVIKDGTEATATNAPTQVGATTSPGEYKITLTSTEMTCDFITVSGISTTSGIIIIPVKITTEHGVLPTIQQGNVGAVVTSGTGTAQISLSSGKVTSLLNASDVTGNITTDLQTIKTQTITCGSAVTINPVIGQSNLIATDSSGRLILQPTQTGVIIPTVTTLTNLPAITANWLTSSGIASGALNGKGDWSIGDTSGITTLLSRLTSTRAGLLDNLDATISSRSTYAGGAVASVTGNIGGFTAAALAQFFTVDSTKLYSDAITGSVIKEIATHANIVSSAINIPAQLADGVIHGGTTASLRLGSSTSTPAFYATNSAGNAVKFEATGADGSGMYLVGFHDGHGLLSVGGTNTGNGMQLQGAPGDSTSGNGGVGHGLNANGGWQAGSGINLYGSRQGDGTGDFAGLTIFGDSSTPGAGCSAILLGTYSNTNAIVNINSKGHQAHGISVLTAGTDKKALLLAGAAATDGFAIAAGSGSPVSIFDANGNVGLKSTAFDNIKESSDTYDIRQVITMIWEMLMSGKLSGLPTSPAVVRDFADTQDRATVHFDSNHNRTSFTVNNAP